jgi:hypothetical protein
MKNLAVTIILFFASLNLLHSQDKDVKTYYAKKYVIIWSDMKTDEFIEESIMGKNVTIYYDEVMKNISIYFTGREGASERVVLTYITKSNNPITNIPHESEVIMSDKFNNIFYVSLDPFKTKSLYQFPQKNKMEGMTYFMKITEISIEKNW